MIRIAIADDHELVREGLKKIFAASGNIDVVGEAADLTSTLGLLERSKVDVLVLDLSLGECSETGALTIIRKSYPSIPVLVLSLHPEEQAAVGAMRGGAAGYVCKSAAASMVTEAISEIASHGRFISERLAELLAEDYLVPIRTPVHARLTAREAEVFTLLGSGHAVKNIAQFLGLSISSVNTYRLRVFHKMQLFSNAALIRYAVRHGINGYTSAAIRQFQRSQLHG